MNNNLLSYNTTNDITKDLSNIIEQAKHLAYQNVNILLIQRIGF